MQVRLRLRGRADAVSPGGTGGSTASPQRSVVKFNPDEFFFFEKMEQQRIQHQKNQKLYRVNNAERIRNYNEHYYETKREKLKSIKRKTQKEPIHINIDEIVATPIH